MYRLAIHLCVRSTTVKCIAKHTVEKPKYPNSLLSSKIFRNTSFFTKVSADMLWKSHTSVSNAGKKRGRGKGTDKRVRKNLNIGQIIGVGKARMFWPGLTDSVIQSNTVMEVQKLSETAVHPKAQRVFETKRFQKIHPLERGWSGRSILGKSLGPPKSLNDVELTNFDTFAVEHKITSKMTPTLGRVRMFKTLCITGNGSGVIGMGSGVGADGKASVAKAMSKASKRLLSFDLIEKHTVNHDFCSVFGSTKVFVWKKPPGFGLKCHRALASCCKLLGITDLCAKVEGSNNLKHIIKAFLIGLMQQKTYEEIVDDKKLHLVEYSENTNFFPKVLASPKQCLSSKEILKENMDFHQYIMNDKVLYVRPKYVPFFKKLPSYRKYMKRMSRLKNFPKVKIELKTHHGGLKSFLADRYPECSNKKVPRKKETTV